MQTRNSLRDAPAVRVMCNPTKNPLRILMLEDSDADAELIVQELQRSGMTIMTGRVDSAEKFTAGLHSFAPDVVLSDHALAQFDSRAAMDILRVERPTIPFIVVAGALTGGQSVAIIRAGAEDIILKSYLSRLPTAITDALTIRRPLQQLTHRQVEVLRLVAEGHRTRDIADRLGLCVKTVESHRGEMMKRLRVHDVVRLVRYAIRVGLITNDALSR
ncbi:MAG: LuxR C-terminal-related transcriptional regulator [Gemmatimonadaceae bacterium]